MSEPITPALTPEEWRVRCYDSPDLRVAHRTRALDGSPRLDIHAKASPIGSGMMGDPRDLHACAALCLAGQPFGFDRKDVKRLRRLSRRLREQAAFVGDDTGTKLTLRDELEREADAFTSLADRIEALLPPEYRNELGWTVGDTIEVPVPTSPEGT